MTRPNKRRVPAEWERQSAVQLTWPHADTDWSEDLPAAEQVFVRIAVEISSRQKLLVVAASDVHSELIIKQIVAQGGNGENICTVVAASNDSWARDHGPITVFNYMQPCLLDFIFNGWGGKYPAGLDNVLTQRLFAANAFGATALESINIELEGGALEFDGIGSLLTTSACLLDARDTEPKSKAEYEELFHKLFGVVHTLWLTCGKLEGDDTDGHIDTLARFTNTGTIAYQGCADSTDEHFHALKKMADELRAFRNLDGNPYKLVELPLPKPIYNSSGKRLPATYANFLIINEAVLVPTYDDAADEEALRHLQTCFADRVIIGIDCRALLQQFGSLHCVTMQYPSGVL